MLHYSYIKYCGSLRIAVIYEASYIQLYMYVATYILYTNTVYVVATVCHVYIYDLIHL